MVNRTCRYAPADSRSFCREVLHGVRQLFLALREYPKRKRKRKKKTMQDRSRFKPCTFTPPPTLLSHHVSLQNKVDFFLIRKKKLPPRHDCLSGSSTGILILGKGQMPAASRRHGARASTPHRPLLLRFSSLLLFPVSPAQSPSPHSPNLPFFAAMISRPGHLLFMMPAFVR